MIAALPVAAVAASVPTSDSFSLKNGTISVSMEWATDPDTGGDVLRGEPVFVPGTAVSCAKVSMIQIARVEVTPGQDYIWQGGEAARDRMMTVANSEAGVVQGFYVDHDSNVCDAAQGCSPYFRDFWNAQESHDGSAKPGEVPHEASLLDYPYGWSLFQRITLESCAQCRDTKKFLGCVSWGGDWPAVGKRSFLTPSATDTPSATFSRALQLFDAYYANE
jgi:hypothetical protein